ncbi:GlxA family transcriptional regulator [Filimonas effusa]|uniref:Helix-turn-helix domain-containing protein n=1 Tax=Filimonas effusa TaxID=2508721 RepID=A0A4V1MAP1_9BACT|nr:helix-turn-helix domain-containing protein [Filimonas effusa]RXK86556.1 helix-turn-helix domain-containing protein [Filimonas effusa]
MIKLIVLNTCQVRPLSMAAILDVFNSVNQQYQHKGLPPFFHIEVAGAGDLPLVPKADLVFIPAFLSGDLGAAVSENREFISWIVAQYQLGVPIASFCTGAFLLAATGLLNGKRATTHVMAAPVFKKLFPHVLLQPEAVVTHDAGLYTSGGATSSFHLMLYLLEKYCGRSMAIEMAKMFSIDMDRQQQLHFAGFSPIRNHSDSVVKNIQEQMEKRYMDITTVDALVREIPVSQRNFVRRFKQATGVTPIDYLQQTRIEAARQLLEHTDLSMMEIMCHVGYGDMKSFRNLFLRITGLTPKAYREKYALAAGRFFTHHLPVMN